MRSTETNRGLRTAGTLLLITALASCTVGPNYRRPSLDVPAAYKGAHTEEKAQAELGLDWWRLFNDQELNALEDEVLKANQNLKEAVARVAQARAAAGSVKGAFYPTVSMDPSVTRQRAPGAGTSAPLSGSSGVTNTSVQIPFDLSYEIDAWGRVRRSYEGAKAQVLASFCDLEVVRQTVTADLATDYFTLRSLDAQHEILARNVALYREQLDLTEGRWKAGLIEETDVLQARAQLESAKAQAADTLRQREDAEHAIAVLAGRPPAGFFLEARPLKSAVPVIPSGVPASVLRRRPDVTEAEENLAAASAQIGVTKADLFPTIKLTGSAGVASSDIADALRWDSRAWSFGPSVSIPILNGGQLSANLKKARARYDELEAAYRNTVLNAFGDVENALTDLQMRAEEAQAQAQAVAASREYLRLTSIQYETGRVDYRNVVNAEQTMVSNELSEAQTLNQRMNSTVLLIKAIGGGWDSEGLYKKEADPKASPSCSEARSPSPSLRS